MITQARESLRFQLSGWRHGSPVAVLGLGIAAVVPLFFVLYTGQIWEDFLITYRFSENLARGHGLVFNPGERVHGFTSVINTLLPALVCWVTQARDFQIPLLVYRIVSYAGLLFALVVTTALLAREAPAGRTRRWIWPLFPVLAVLEIKITAFTMNGQEAGFMLGFFAPAFALACAGWTRHWALGGLCFAGLMYTRPDGFVYIFAVATAALIFNEGPRRELATALLRSIGLCLLFYLPWALFTLAYYGSPIPHTITAKHGTEGNPQPAFAMLGPLVAGIGILPQKLTGVFTAIYDFLHTGEGHWPRWVRDAALGFAGLAAVYWLIPTRDRIGRMASLIAAAILAYLTYANLVTYSCPWYYPPLAFMSLLTLTRLLLTLAGASPYARPGRLAAAGLLAGLVCLLAYVFTYSLRSLRLKQEVIDDGARRQIGQWLRQNVADRETVYLEPLGYIGYYSQRTIRDWPGLVAPQVVRLRREIGQSPHPWGNYRWGPVAERLQPDWIVARPTEADQIKHSRELTARYRLVRVFNATAQIDAAGAFPGSAITYSDAVFMIYRRQSPPAP